MEEVLAAPERLELVEMVRHAPLLHQEGRHLMVHAGLHPAWSLDGALGIANEVEESLRSKDWVATMAKVYEAEVKGWKPKRKGAKRYRSALNYFTRARFLDRDLAVTENAGPPHQAKGKERPWYEFRSPLELAENTIVFGHWSTLGLHKSQGLLGLDTGCVYGRALTAARLEDGAIFQVPGLSESIGY
jgi:bis(5'-nucleosyl)-tetraphosphatase (symmetrical)